MNKVYTLNATYYAALDINTRGLETPKEPET